MTTPLSHWINLYKRLKGKAVCLDIERTRFNGPIAVLGLFEPKDGVVECSQLVRGRGLRGETVREALRNYELLVTYNGLRNDIPAIEKEFPGALASGRKVLDLYLFSRMMQMNAGLKTWENTLHIERPSDSIIRKGTAIRLWQRYEQLHDRRALDLLLAYNRQDTINLYPLAEGVMALSGNRSATA
jgi:uncharacterized protein